MVGQNPISEKLQTQFSQVESLCAEILDLCDNSCAEVSVNQILKHLSLDELEQQKSDDLLDCKEKMLTLCYDTLSKIKEFLEYGQTVNLEHFNQVKDFAEKNLSQLEKIINLRILTLQQIQYTLEQIAYETNKSLLQHCWENKFNFFFKVFNSQNISMFLLDGLCTNTLVNNTFKLYI
ncbi:hypothetical protein AB837_00590 [bacterium AB1]|nr:hypothetical protein AB837_00590 [bacterium AB1]